MQRSTSKASWYVLAQTNLRQRFVDELDPIRSLTRRLPLVFPRVAGVEDGAECPRCERLIIGTNNYYGYIPHYLLRGREVACHDLGTHNCSLICYRGILNPLWTVTGSHATALSTSELSTYLGMPSHTVTMVRPLLFQLR